MREFELRIPVAIWMRDRNLTPIMEMQSMRNCDMVGVKFEKRAFMEHKRIELVVAVELKVKDARGVIRQAESHKWDAHEIWCAMPWDRIEGEPVLSLFLAAGVGLLAVNVSERRCSVVVPSPSYVPENPQRILNTAWRRRKEYLGRMRHPHMLRIGQFMPASAPLDAGGGKGVTT